jgi:hypothetical protein
MPLSRFVASPQRRMLSRKACWYRSWLESNGSSFLPTWRIWLPAATFVRAKLCSSSSCCAVARAMRKSRQTGRGEEADGLEAAGDERLGALLQSHHHLSLHLDIARAHGDGLWVYCV